MQYTGRLYLINDICRISLENSRSRRHYKNVMDKESVSAEAKFSSKSKYITRLNLAVSRKRVVF